LTAYAKIHNCYPDCSTAIEKVFEEVSISADPELQQRACEYLKLAQGSSDMRETIFAEMPEFPEKDKYVASA
jgi:AP-2 complex subunit alpha